MTQYKCGKAEKRTVPFSAFPRPLFLKMLAGLQLKYFHLRTFLSPAYIIGRYVREFIGNEIIMRLLCVPSQVVSMISLG